MPQDHLILVEEAICDGWKRCRDNYTALADAGAAAKAAAVSKYGWDPFNIQVAPKFAVLELLLADCDTWIDESDTSGLGELPPLSLHVGENNKTRTVTLSSQAYIMMAEQEVKEMR